MSDSIVRTPWKDYMGEVPMHLEYFDGSMFEAVEQIAKKYPGNIAFTFMGKSTTYRQMIREIEQCAKALKTIGVREGDKVTIAMPNCPQAIYMFYAVNLVGGIANMIHPLSAEKEIEFYLNASESVAAVTLDQFYNKFEKVRERTKVVNMIIASVRDALSPTIKDVPRPRLPAPRAPPCVPNPLRPRTAPCSVSTARAARWCWTRRT